MVAVGGARGITAEVVGALAEHFRPRIYLLGSNPLDAYPDTVFEGDDETFAATRRSYIRENLAGGGRTVAEVNRAFDRLLDARAARRTIGRLEEFCGADRVTYLTCDVRDETAVGRAVDRILAEQPAVDLLVNAAGRNRSALIKDKGFAEFRAVRDLKALAYRNLKRAFAGRAPATWCNFGSLLGHFGQLGEPDYAAGNDYLAAAAVDAAAHGADEFTVGWTLWEGVGMGAHELTKAYFERAGSYSHMPIPEGVHHFLQELHADRRTASVVHVGAAERETIEGFYPGYLAHPAPGASAPGGSAPGGSEPEGPGKGAFYLRETLSSDADSAVFACVFDLSTDGYLAHHTVGGVPTLPGTFVVEIATEAAHHLVPGLRPVVLEDLRFAHFLRVHDTGRSAPVPKKITARVAERGDELTVVEVSITSDVRAPGGLLLVKDRVHFTARVLLRRERPEAPAWQHWDDGDDVPVVDPYHAPASPVSLTGPFVSTARTRLHPLGKRSVYRADIAVGDPAFSRFTTPAILLDGLARTGVLHLEHGRLVPVAAPLSIRRVDLYEEANDIELTRRYGRLHLYVTPTGFDMTGEVPDNRFVAVTPEGRVVAQMQGVRATVVGQIDAVSGRLYRPGRATVARARRHRRPEEGRLMKKRTTTGDTVEEQRAEQAPGPAGSVLFGALSSFRKDTLRLLTELQRQYGGVARMKMGPYLVHQVTAPEAVKHILQDNAGNYVRGRFYRGFNLFFGRGMLTTDGAEWRTRRAVSRPFLLRAGLRARSDVVTDTVQELLARWEPSARTGDPVDITDDMMWLAMGVLGRMLFGVDLRVYADRLLPAVRFSLKAMILTGEVEQLLPRWVPTAYQRRLKRHQRVLNDVMDEIIDLHRRGEGSPDSVVAALLKATHEVTGEPFTQRQIRAELKTLFLAGHETTGCALTWTLYAIAQHEDVRRRLDAELTEVLDGRVPTAEDVDDLPYLRAVVDESLRLYPPIWLFPRDAVADDRVGGYHVPAGSTVLVPVYAAHHNPAVWDNPEAFAPERFCPAHTARLTSGTSRRRDRYDYFPFGGGARKCIGMDLALLELRLAVAMVAQRYRLQLVAGHPVSPAALVSLRPQPGVLMHIRPADRTAPPA
ncbi:cytochrome P450 [Streptomyces phaeoluteigriseus]